MTGRWKAEPTEQEPSRLLYLSGCLSQSLAFVVALMLLGWWFEEAGAIVAALLALAFPFGFQKWIVGRALRDSARVLANWTIVTALGIALIMLMLYASLSV